MHENFKKFKKYFTSLQAAHRFPKGKGGLPTIVSDARTMTLGAPVLVSTWESERPNLTRVTVFARYIFLLIFKQRHPVLEFSVSLRNSRIFLKTPF